MKATKRYSLTADDKVVEAGDPAAVKLLVGKGGEIPAEYESQINQEDAERDEGEGLRDESAKEPLVEVDGVKEAKPTKAKAPMFPAKAAAPAKAPTRKR